MSAYLKKGGLLDTAAVYLVKPESKRDQSLVVMLAQFSFFRSSSHDGSDGGLLALVVDTTHSHHTLSVYGVSYDNPKICVRYDSPDGQAEE